VKRLLVLVAMSLVALALVPGRSPAAGFRRCSTGAKAELRTHDISCSSARTVLHRLFEGKPTTHPQGRPRGWTCLMRQGDHTTEGGVIFTVICHANRDPGRRLRYFWIV
jgi:hypothetical protein